MDGELEQKQEETNGPSSVVRKTEDGRYLLKDGEEQTPISEAEMFRLAQLSHGAHRKFEEAHEKLLRAEELSETAKNRLTQTKEALRQMDQGSVEGYKQILDFMEIPADQQTPLLENWRNSWAEDVENTSEGEPTVSDQNKLRVEQLPEELQELLQFWSQDNVIRTVQKAQQGQRKAREQEILDDAWKEVEQDSTLGKILKNGSPTRVKALRTLTDKLVEGRIRAGESWGSDLRKGVRQEVANLLNEIGVGSATTPIAGLGAGPAYSQSESQTETPPERVSITDPQYLKVLGQRMHSSLFKKRR